jgi:hypothetical protein
MTARWPAACLTDEIYDGGRMLAELEGVITRSAMTEDRRRRTVRSSGELVTVMDGLAGETLQDRWRAFEWQVWPHWLAGVGRTGDSRWSFAVAMLVAVQAVRPSWPFLECTYTRKWVRRLPEDAPLQIAYEQLMTAVDAVAWSSAPFREKAVKTGLRVMMVAGHTELEHVTDEDLRGVPLTVSSGGDVLDAALCSLGVLGRTPLRGAARRMRSQRLTPTELAERSRIPDRFREVHVLYLEHYQQRISNVYATTRHKHNSLEHFWCFIAERYPEITTSAAVRPAHVRAFIPVAIELARTVQRGPGAGEREDRSTAMQWLTNLRCFFADVCTWAAEPGSPFEGLAPAAVPLERHDLRNLGFDKVRRRAHARAAETVIDLEREIPKIRAIAIRRWDDAAQLRRRHPECGRGVTRRPRRSGTGRSLSCYCRAGCGSRRPAS